jgi:hypothetical protein
VVLPQQSGHGRRHADQCRADRAGAPQGGLQARRPDDGPQERTDRASGATVSRSLPEGLWLLEIKQAGSSVQIDGRATSLTAVTDFTERLQSSGYFKRPVEIIATGTEAIEEKDVVRFTVKADPVPSQPAAGAAGTAAAASGSVAAVSPGTPGAS